MFAPPRYPYLDGTLIFFVFSSYNSVYFNYTYLIVHLIDD